MNENESGQTPNENENNVPNENEANQGNESGLDATELRTMIKNLSAQVDSLKAELAKKEPEPPVDRSKEVNDYFLNLMKGKVKGE
ncbi:MAG: hypothetical protein J6Q89_03880 [Clostridia bacterium]|nr:hypothetical protein [Clostridia bacterium]